MKKKWLAVLAALVLAVCCVAFVACDDVKDNSDDGGNGGGAGSSLPFAVKETGSKEYTLNETLTGSRVQDIQVVETNEYDVVDVFFYANSNANSIEEFELTPAHFQMDNSKNDVSPDYIYTDGIYYTLSDPNAYRDLNLETIVPEQPDGSVVQFGISESDFQNTVTFSYSNSANGNRRMRRYSLLFKKGKVQNALHGTASINFITNGENGGQVVGMSERKTTDNDEIERDTTYDLKKKAFLLGFVYGSTENSVVPRSRYQITNTVRSVTYGESGTYVLNTKTVVCPTVTISTESNVTLSLDKFTLKSGETTLTALGFCDGDKSSSNQKSKLGDIWQYYKATSYMVESVPTKKTVPVLRPADGDTKLELYFGDDVPETYALYYDGAELKA